MPATARPGPASARGRRRAARSPPRRRAPTTARAPPERHRARRRSAARSRRPRPGRCPRRSAGRHRRIAGGRSPLRSWHVNPHERTPGSSLRAPYSPGMPTALVTGASSGIGEAFARALAARGTNLVLVARSAARLEALAAELTARHGVRADTIAADLSDPGAPDAILAELRVRALEIDTLINNAGFGTHGDFAALDGRRERDEVIVNAYAPVALTRLLLPAMIARKHGAIVNVASTAAFQPVPYMATYGATKAFVLSFGEALAEEVRAHGVRVVVLCPGQTDTAFFAGIDEARVGRARTPEAGRRHRAARAGARPGRRRRRRCELRAGQHDPVRAAAARRAHRRADAAPFVVETVATNEPAGERRRVRTNDRARRSSSARTRCWRCSRAAGSGSRPRWDCSRGSSTRTCRRSPRCCCRASRCSGTDRSRSRPARVRRRSKRRRACPGCSPNRRRTRHRRPACTDRSSKRWCARPRSSNCGTHSTACRTRTA